MNLQNYRKYDIFLKLPDFFNIFKISWLHISGTNKDKKLVVFYFAPFDINYKFKKKENINKFSFFSEKGGIKNQNL